MISTTNPAPLHVRRKLPIVCQSVRLTAGLCNLYITFARSSPKRRNSRGWNPLWLIYKIRACPHWWVFNSPTSKWAIEAVSTISTCPCRHQRVPVVIICYGVTVQSHLTQFRASSPKPHFRWRCGTVSLCFSKIRSFSAKLNPLVVICFFANSDCPCRVLFGLFNIFQLRYWMKNVCVILRNPMIIY